LLRKATSDDKAESVFLFSFTKFETVTFRICCDYGCAPHGHTHIRSTTRAAIRQAMRKSFCPAVCAACEAFVFQECPDLKAGNWEIFGSGVSAHECRRCRSEETDNAETEN